MKVTSFGEVLWDDFESGKVLGGAPLNVMVRLSNLGADAAMISRRGQDADGDELVRQVAAKNVKTDFIQTDTEQATSLVKVSLDAKGCASYEIVYPCAWDRIAVENAALQRVAESDAFVFGSLAVRDEVSLASLRRYLEVAKFKIFDVNLREPFYTTELLLDLMKQANMLKLNDDELQLVAEALGSKYHSVEQNIRFIAELTDTSTICVTLGNHGAVLFQDNRFVHHSGFRVQVADTVGAGDSFLGALIYKLLNRADPKEAITFACALGGMVASKHGATPQISLEEIERFMYPM
ncbi:carbohydrate kinase family protein [Alysiella crassa]|uniref:Bifunctional protein hldE n=1 Tax=Alysiella crassa TaxID=153491 RepID=A0A376BTW2_9NEIS|nr:carbohydrate kinase [Alysiella crassa]UOP05855.1 carbohydrate kinase [Alysiella crassa]SSY80281.1 Bifunctional protein hldE [Alysiella crassa]